MIAQIDPTVVADLERYARDTQRMFWVTRNGRPVQRRWRQFSDEERALQVQADERAAYVAEFIY